MDTKEWKTLVKSGLDSYGLNIEENEAELLFAHSAEMLKWNRTTNLTSIKTPEEVALKHVVDSCIPAKYCRDISTLLDIGTGAGFPGIPLKILLPDLRVTLVETVRKKVSFLKHVIRLTGLKGIEAVQGRAEKLSHEPDYCGRYDAVICRAFTALDSFVNMAVPYIKEDGVIFAMKGRDAEQESELLSLVNTRLGNGRQISASDLVTEQISYRLPVTDAERVLFIIRLAADPDPAQLSS